MKKKIMSILLVVALFVTMSAFVFAAEGTDAAAATATTGTTAVTAPETGSTGGGTVAEDNKVTYEAPQAGQENEKTKVKGTEKIKTNNSDSEKKVSELNDPDSTELQSKLKELEKASMELEAKYKEALRLKDEGMSLELKEQLRVMKEEIKSKKDEINQARKQLREAVRAAYTEQELAGLAEVEDELKKDYPTDKVLPVDSIVPHGFSFKFDTPPVIREGRTLVPVRALTEGLGATVAWNAATSTVLIEKDGIKIELQLANKKAFVNGKEVELEVPPTSLNNRTVVPLRFIAEQFGYKIEFDSATETIELVNAQTPSVVQ